MAESWPRSTVTACMAAFCLAVSTLAINPPGGSAQVRPPECPPGLCSGLADPPVPPLAGLVAFGADERRGLGPPPFQIENPIGEGKAFLSSLAVPGLAQYRQGKRRWIAYAGFEIASAFLWLDARSDALGLRTDYRDFAWAAARFGSSTGPRQDGDFEYYERLQNWRGSGRWDADPDLAGLQPESDPTTYNGSVWALAAQIFNLNPAAPHQSAAYDQALDYYREHGYGPPFLWAWRQGSADQDHFSGLIADTDSRAKDASAALWMLVANHVVSSLDGFITARLHALPQTESVGLVISARVP